MAPASVLTIESSIPQGITIDEYRRSRHSAKPRQRGRRAVARLANLRAR